MPSLLPGVGQDGAVAVPDRLAETRARLNAWHKDPQATTLDLYFSPADIALLLGEVERLEAERCRMRTEADLLIYMKDNWQGIAEKYIAEDTD